MERGAERKRRNWGRASAREEASGRGEGGAVDTPTAGEI